MYESESMLGRKQKLDLLANSMKGGGGSADTRVQGR